ncbi:MAG: L-lactate permease [bacterium]|nr:L-lactate permease [bacterium]
MSPESVSIQSSPFLWALSFSPVLVLIILMLGLRWGGKRAGPAGLAVGLGVAFLGFGMLPQELLQAVLRGVLLSAPVLYIIIPALILYHVADAAGGIRNIGWSVSEMTQNHILQLLILAFGFTSFLQGVAGFGVPVAVVAPLLIGIGYPPVQAVAVSLLGHAWSVSMGDMASSFQAILTVTDLPPHEVGLGIALLLSFAGIVTAVSVAHLHAGWSAVRRWWNLILIMGLITSLTQLFLAWMDMWIIATFGAGMLCLLTGFALAKFRRFQGPSRPPSMPPKPEEDRVRPVEITSDRRMSFSLAFSPYYALIAVVAVVTFFPGLHDLLHAWKLRVFLPEIRTPLGIVTASKVWHLAPFGHPGALLLYTAILGWLLYKVNGRWPRNRPSIFRATFREVYPTAVGIVSMTVLATVMTASGMIQVLATGAASVSGGLYPVISPFVGLLGSFVTGSNTNSNILFGGFQKEVAALVHKNPIVIVSAQSAGGSLGSMIAPAKVLVGCATAGLGGREGEVFRRVAGYCLVQVALVGLLALWLSR